MHPDSVEPFMVCFDEGGRGRCSTWLFAPGARLRPWVEHFWVQTYESVDSRPWRIVPDASSHIVFSTVDRQPRCALVGSRKHYCDIDIGRRRVTLGARLRPGASMHLARCGADVLTDGAFPLEDIFGARGRGLRSRMAESTPRQALGHKDEFISGKLACREPDSRVEQALHAAHSVADAAILLGISVRTFREQSLRQTGLAPKRILRIRRLYRALARGRMAWSDVAFHSGYADQGHMVREFRSLLGDSPEEWRRRAADFFNTTPLPSASLRS